MSSRNGRFALIWILILATIYLGDRLVRGLLLTADAPRAVTARGSLADAERTAIDLFERTAPSVVYIFTRDGAGRARGAGSGFIWDRAGHVVTNNHVVEGASRVSIRLDDGEVVDGRVVGTAPDYDLAVVRRVAHRTGVMRDGRLRELRPTAELFDDPRDEYTRELLAAIAGRRAGVVQ